MEGEKYNLAKAQEEAEKLKQKVDSGEASNYGDAEKLVEQETKKREAIATQIGLKADSKLVEVLGSLDKDAREEVMSSLSDRANATFGDHDAKGVVKKVFQSLNYNTFAGRIQTPEDFRRYADKVMEVAELHLKKDKEGEVGGQYSASCFTAQTVADMTWLVRGDFDRDLDTMLQMMRDNPSPDQKATIFGALHGVKDLIKTSEDLERFGQFVKRLSGKGFDAKTIFFGDQGDYAVFGKWHGEKEYMGEKDKAELARFKEWQAILTDSKKLNDALSVMEAAFTHGADPREFVKKINSFRKNGREQFIQLAQKFASKDISPQFVADNLPLLQNCDFSKDGLGIFTTFDSQKKWLEYCVKVWKQNPQNIENIAKFFNEALSLEIKTISKKEYKVGNIKGLFIDELADIQENVDEELGSAKEIIKPNEKLRAYASKLLQSALGELYESKNFEAIINIQPAISIPELQKRLSLYTLSALTFERADVKHSLNLDEISEDDYKNAFEIAKRHSQEWQDEQPIAGPFQAGAETFGYKRMLELHKAERFKSSRCCPCFPRCLGII